MLATAVVEAAETGAVRQIVGPLVRDEVLQKGQQADPGGNAAGAIGKHPGCACGGAVVADAGGISPGVECGSIGEAAA